MIWKVTLEFKSFMAPGKTLYDTYTIMGRRKEHTAIDEAERYVIGHLGGFDTKVREVVKV